MRAQDFSGFPSVVPGLNLQSDSPCRAASSRRREPELRATLLSSTLPSTSIRKFSCTTPVSFARKAAAGYGGFSHALASTTAAVFTGARGFSGAGAAGAAGGGIGSVGFTAVTAVIVGVVTGTCTCTSGGGIYGGGG